MLGRLRRKVDNRETYDNGHYTNVSGWRRYFSVRCCSYRNVRFIGMGSRSKKAEAAIDKAINQVLNER